MYDLKYFLSNYMEGWKSFFIVVNLMGLEVNIYVYFMKGFFGEDLVFDVIFIGNFEVKKILVILLVIYGVEGMLGFGV